MPKVKKKSDRQRKRLDRIRKKSGKVATRESNSNEDVSSVCGESGECVENNVATSGNRSSKRGENSGVDSQSYRNVIGHKNSFVDGDL